MPSEPVTIGVINYNGGLLVQECIRSALGQDYANFTVLVVDNGSTDTSLAGVKKEFPRVEVVELPVNSGPPAARNRVINRANTRLVLCLDNDVVLKSDCLGMLLQAMQDNEDVAVCGPRVLDYDQRDRVQFGVTYFHYTGAVVVSHSAAEEPQKVGSVGGGAILIDKEKAFAAGFYDETFFFGLEDNDFCMRQHIAGHGCLNVPGAIIYHKGKERGLWAAYYQVRNRWLFLLKNYSCRTLAVIWPALLVYELFTIGFLIWSGKPGGYFRAIFSVLRNSPQILEQRRRIQSVRKLSDREILCGGEVYMREENLAKRPIRAAHGVQNFIFACYWKLARKLI